MSRDVAVALLVPVVLGHIVQVVTSDDDGTLHLGGDDDALEDLAADGDAGGEGALAVDVVGLDGLLGSLEAKTDVLVVSDTRGSLLGEQFFGVEEDVVLFLEGTLVLSDGGGTWMSAIGWRKIIFNLIKLIFTFPPLPPSKPDILPVDLSMLAAMWRVSVYNICWMVRIIENYTLYEIIG